MEESLTNSKAEILKLRSALTSTGDQVHLLNHQLEELDVKFSEEVRIRDEKLNKQSSDLESKANTVAMLTQQLYNTKVRLRNELQAQSVNGSASSHTTSSTVCVCPHCHFHKRSPAHVTDERCALVEGGVPAATGANNNWSRISRIQRRHFRNSSSPVAQDVRNFSEFSDDNLFSKQRTSGRRLPTPPLTPRPPPTAAYRASSMIRRASNPIRKQSPSPWSSRGQLSSDSSSSVTPCASISSLTDESAQSSDSVSTTSVSNGGRVLDPVQVFRQGVLPQELSELLKSHESGGDLREQPQQLVISKPDPLPPIPSDDDISDQTTPTQSELFHDDPDPATSTVDFDGYATTHPFEPSPPWFKGHPHHTHHHHPVAIGSRQQHRHFILTKAQGLRSAPSKVRLLRYTPQKQQQQEEGGASGSGLLLEAKDSVIDDDDDEEKRGTAEGTLLVRETISSNDSALQQLHQH